MQKNNNEYYSTSDLGLAASLNTKGFSVIDVDKSSPRRVAFLFKKRRDLEITIEDYWSGNLNLSASSLMDSIKYLKALIYE